MAAKPVVMTDDEQREADFWMGVWYRQAQVLARQFARKRKRPNANGEQLVILSSSFLLAAGCVQLHGEELERNKQSLTRYDKPFIKLDQMHPILVELRDRRDMLNHGFLSRAYAYSSSPRWTIGEEEEVTLARALKGHIEHYTLPAEQRPLFPDIGEPVNKLLSFEWEDKDTGKPIGDVGEWEKNVLKALRHLMKIVRRTDFAPI
jgi:hypothetical protein